MASNLLSHMETADALVREIGEDRVSNVGISTRTDTISIHLVDESEAARIAHVQLNLEDDRDFDAFSTYVGTYRGVQVLLFGARREAARYDIHDADTGERLMGPVAKTEARRIVTEEKTRHVVARLVQPTPVLDSRIDELIARASL